MAPSSASAQTILVRTPPYPAYPPPGNPAFPPSGNLRYGLCPAGDVDGDGIWDLAFSGYGCTGSPSSCGGWVVVHSAATGQLITSFFQPDLGSDWQVSLAGDLDGDGFPELAIRRHATVLGTLNEITIWSPHANSTVYTLVGNTIADGFGRSFDTIGDLDGDGVTDFVVGSPLDDGLAVDVGRVSIYSGATGSLLWTVQGWLQSHQFGINVLGVGDVTGDSLPEFVFSHNVGGISIWPFLHCVSPATSQVVWTLAHPQACSLGAVLAAVPDVDGDGVREILTPKCLNLFSTSLWVLSGATGQMIGSFTSPPGPWSEMGGSSVVLSDAQGDGQPDFLVSGLVYYGPSWPPPSLLGLGHTYLVPWPALSPPLVYTAAPPYFVMPSEPLADGRIISLPDVNDDGLDDAAWFEAEGWGLTFQTTVAVASLLPLGVQVSGSGCQGSGGYVPVIGAGSIPQLGATFPVYLSKALGGAPGILLLGLSNSSWGGASLPLDLGPIGLLGCALEVSPDFVLPAATSGLGPGSGKATVVFDMPSVPWLAGAQVYFQWFVPDAGAGSVGALSREMAVTIQ